jgi:hypothetical protein
MTSDGREFPMTEITWIAQHKDIISKWYQNESGIFADLSNVKGVREDGLIWYESFIANYVAKHSEMFRRKPPVNIWFELNLGDTRAIEDIDTRVKPDLILQYEDEIWIIEVKYEQYSPDPNTDLVRNTESQIRGYKDQITKLQREGWFPSTEARMAVFWAYWEKRAKPLGTEESLAKWPIQR